MTLILDLVMSGSIVIACLNPVLNPLEYVLQATQKSHHTLDLSPLTCFGPGLSIFMHILGS